MQKWCLSLLVCLSLTMLATACRDERDDVPAPQPSVYYWRTNFALSAEEQTFLREHRVGKMYLRYFDVVLNEAKQAVPNATLTFSDTMPRGVEVIPTVFISEEVLRHPQDSLPEKLVRRILQMSQTNDVRNVQEVQLDCDWTERSRRACFALFDAVRHALRTHGIRLSATIRLHQLRMPPPPVDYGVLMVYNTGAAYEANGRNPILDLRDVEPFLSALSDYDLPLCAAYPDFSWRRLFGKAGFKGILYGDEAEDTLVFAPRSADSYIAISARHVHTALAGGNQAQLFIAVGDSLLVSRSEQSVIEAVQRAIARRRPGIHRQVVLYPLDKANLSRRNAKQYETIFHP